MSTKLLKGFEMRDDGLVVTSFENLDNYLLAELQKGRIEMGTKVVGEIERLKIDYVGKGGNNHKDYWRGFSDLAFGLDEFIGKDLAKALQGDKNEI